MKTKVKEAGWVKNVSRGEWVFMCLAIVDGKPRLVEFVESGTKDKGGKA